MTEGAGGEVRLLAASLLYDAGGFSQCKPGNDENQDRAEQETEDGEVATAWFIVSQPRRFRAKTRSAKSESQSRR